MRKSILLAALLGLATVAGWAQDLPEPKTATPPTTAPQTTAPQVSPNRDAYGQPRVNAYNLIQQSTYDRYVTFNASLRYGVGLPLGTQRDYISSFSPANAILTMEWQFPQILFGGVADRLPVQSAAPAPATDHVYVGRDDLGGADPYPNHDAGDGHGCLLFQRSAAPIRPYVQLAGGGAFVNYTNYYGLLTDTDKKFAGAIAPAIGVKVFGKREKGLGGELQAQYQNVFYKYNEINGAQNLMLSAGLTYRFY